MPQLEKVDAVPSIIIKHSYQVEQTCVLRKSAQKGLHMRKSTADLSLSLSDHSLLKPLAFGKPQSVRSVCTQVPSTSSGTCTILASHKVLDTKCEPQSVRSICTKVPSTSSSWQATKC